MSEATPRLRSGDKSRPPHSLNEIPRPALLSIGRSIAIAKVARGLTDISGPYWEQIVARAFGADWRNSNLGLDDVQLGSACWGAKTVKNDHPERVNRVRLISGRNSLDYSYRRSDPRDMEPAEVGGLVLGIWNQRVSQVRERFATVRTIVLVKSPTLTKNAVFEFDTVRYDPELFVWRWNHNRNLEGHDPQGVHRFTWQPHGSQFTIIEMIRKRWLIEIEAPSVPDVSEDDLAISIGFNPNWVRISPLD